MGRGGGASPPALVQHSTWRLEGRESFIFYPLHQMMNPMNPKANVLIDKNGHARLADFGLASIVPGNQSVVSLPDANMTIATTWAAPEISNGGSLTKAGDVFTFAMVAVEVCAGGFFGRSFSTCSRRTDVYRASPIHQMLRCCVDRGTS